MVSPICFNPLKMLAWAFLNSKSATALKLKLKALLFNETAVKFFMLCQSFSCYTTWTNIKILLEAIAAVR
jgi:hypothetical protein